jgi:adenine-specific DNA-methyltransferase
MKQTKKTSSYDGWSRERLIERLSHLEERKKYGLVWDEERKEEFELAAGDSLPVLQEVMENAIRGNPAQPTHILIEGDNHHALSALGCTHEKAVDIIYIDPPYNRGLKESNDSRYNDRYVDREHAFRHSKWLAFMAKRLRMAKDLLKDSGVIFISIDDNELAQLKLLMDEIFGEENYKNTIIIRRGAKNVQAQFDTIDKLSSGYEYVLFYARTAKQRFPKMVKELDHPKHGGWNNHWRGTNRPTMRYELFGIKPETGQWRWGRERSLTAGENYRQLLREVGEHPTQHEIDAWVSAKFAATGEELDLLRLSANGKPEHYVPPTDTTLLNDVWFDISPNSTSVLKSIFGRKVFDNPKPLELVKRILKFAGTDAVILDFFAGSGTTAHAVLEANREDGGTRQAILVTNNENDICTEVCFPRISRVMKGYQNPRGVEVEGLGGSLKYYRTAFVPVEAGGGNRGLLLQRLLELLCLREATFDLVSEGEAWKVYENRSRYTAILFEPSSIPALKKHLAALEKPVRVYVFSPQIDDFSADFADVQDKVTACVIPESILKAYRGVR